MTNDTSDMITDLDNLKSQWQSLSRPASVAPVQMPDSRRLQSAPEKIAKIYRRLSIISALWAVISIMYIGSGLFPTWLCIVMSGYFLLGTVANRWILHLVSDINFGEMTVVEALESVIELQRSRIILQCIGIALCAGLLTLMFIHFMSVSPLMVIGGIVGAVVGLAIGLAIDSRVRRQIRTMRRLLESALTPA